MTNTLNTRAAPHVAVGPDHHAHHALTISTFEPSKWRKVVLLAVAQDGRALQYAGPQLQADFEVLAVAVTQTAAALQFVSDSVSDQVTGAWHLINTYIALIDIIDNRQSI
eukprot:SAG31_NODE_4089_length_3600_cov_8.534704_2_plen_110_part_00